MHETEQPDIPEGQEVHWTGLNISAEKLRDNLNSPEGKKRINEGLRELARLQESEGPAESRPEFRLSAGHHLEIH